LSKGPPSPCSARAFTRSSRAMKERPLADQVIHKT
jgi:hypothetical protein